MVTLTEVTRDNWVECIRLQLKDSQKGNLASNVETIAESKFEEHHRLRAICLLDRVVGMLAYAQENDPPDEELYWIFRLMIDKDYQRQGVGVAAMKLAMDELTELGALRIRTMHKPANRAAAGLYQKLGFESIGFLDDGDVLLEIEVGKSTG